MYKTKSKYDELEILSYIVNELTPPISLTNISRTLNIPRIRIARILRRLQRKWWIAVELNIRRICLDKIIVLLNKPSRNVVQKAAFVGKTIEDRILLVFLLSNIRDPYEFVDRIDNVVSYYVFNKVFYNKPLFKKYFVNGYLKVDLKTILTKIIDDLDSSLEHVGPDYSIVYPEGTGCVQLSRIDRKIIEKLVCNGLLSTRSLARTLNTVQSKINRRIRHLVKTSIIPGFTVGYSRITDMGEQLFWIVFVIKFNSIKEAFYFIEKLVRVPFVGHIDYDSRNNMVKLVLRVYRENIGYVYDIAKIIVEKLNVIDTMIVSTKESRFQLNNILSNNVFHVRVN